MRRTLLRVLVTVVALAVILVAGDLAARRYGLRRVAEEVQQQYSLPQRPEVSVAGGSFLWQAVRGRFEDVTLTMDTLPTPSVPLSDVRVRIPAAEVPLGVLLGRPGTVDLAQGTVRADVGYGPLAQQVSRGGLDVDLSRAGSNVRAGATVRVLGFGVDLAVIVTPTLDGGDVRLDPVEARVGGAKVPLSRAEQLLEAAGFDGWSISLDDVPGEVELQDLQVIDAGVRVQGALRAGSVEVA
ncbi:MAG: LmeA family phospholipid-binding protein [Janthinobacterium lividum]